MAERKKISELTELSNFTGTELFPLVSHGTNYSATMDSMKEYFKDSALVLFDEIDDSTDTPVSGGTPQDEDGVTLAMVFLTKRGTFAQRRRKDGANDAYFSDFPRQEDYLTDSGTPRTDKVFFCFADKCFYVQDGSLRNIFDTVRINVMTEEELENLEHPIEGALYATYE